MYSPWTGLHASTDSNWIVSGASAHRIVSDLSAPIGRQYGHSIVVAGDLNILHGYGDRGSAYWAKRYETVFTRMKALRLPFVADRKRPTDDRLIRGLTSCQGTARTGRPTTRIVRRRVLRHAS